MRSKLNYLISMSLKRKIKTKWFLIANIFLATLIIGLINIDKIVTFFGGDFNKKQVIYVIDNTDEAHLLFENQLNIIEDTLNKDKESSYEIKLTNKKEAEAKDIIKAEEKAWVIVFNEDLETTINVTLITKGYIDAIDYQLITSAINNTKVSLAIQKTTLPIDEVSALYSSIDIKREYIDNDKLSEDEGMSIIMTTVFPIFILPFFMLVIYLVQMIGAEVNDEKSTRGMEIIISNVSPTTHFFAKIIAGNIFVLLQGGLLILFGLLGLLIRKIFGGESLLQGIGGELGEVLNNMTSSGVINQFIYIIPFVLLLMILTFVSYSLIAGVLASMTTNTEDFQQLQSPIMLILLVSYYLAIFASFMKGSIFIKIVAFIPLMSAILAPSLLMLKQITIFSFLISIVIVIIFNWLLIKFGLKIYKVGILNYSSQGLWKKMFKALKN